MDVKGFMAICVAGLAALSPRLAVAEPKIVETMVAPPAARHNGSPMGEHVVTIADKGSRVVMIYDGMEGPAFDEILVKAIFNATGDHWVYAGRSGKEFSLLMDGKEIERGEYFDGRLQDVAFTPDGNHVFYLNPTRGGGMSPEFLLVVDGKPVSPLVSRTKFKVVFTPDGRHYLYAGTNTAGKPFLLIDGKEAAYFGDDAQFLGNTAQVLSRTHDDRSMTLLLDGKPVLKAANIDKVFISPTGAHYVAAYFREATREAGAVFLDGKDILPLAKNEGVANVVFSPDGAHYAIDMGTVAVLDGKKGLEYKAISKISYSQDSSKVLYVGLSQSGKHVVVVNGEETSMVLDDPTFGGPDGRHVAGFVLVAGGSNLSIDGKTIASGNAHVESLVFSRDGAHYAFAAANALFLDGVSLPGITPQGFANSDITSNVTSHAPIFSPDGKHIAYAGTSGTGRNSRTGIAVDGHMITHTANNGGGRIMAAAFTPDSRHLFYAINERPNGNTNYWTLHLDGKPVVKFPEVPLALDSDLRVLVKNTRWEMRPDGSLCILVAEGSPDAPPPQPAKAPIKRLVITPAEDTGIESMLADAAEPAASEPAPARGRAATPARGRRGN